MDFPWFPDWRTGAALGIGVACALYSRIKPPASNSPDFQEKWVKGLPLLIGSVLIVLPTWVAGAIFLAFGWKSSPWEWSVAGLVLFLWVPWRMWNQWFGESKKHHASGNPRDGVVKR